MRIGLCKLYYELCGFLPHTDVTSICLFFPYLRFYTCIYCISLYCYCVQIAYVICCSPLLVLFIFIIHPGLTFSMQRSYAGTTLRLTRLSIFYFINHHGLTFSMQRLYARTTSRLTRFRKTLLYISIFIITTFYFFRRSSTEAVSQFYIGDC